MKKRLKDLRRRGLAWLLMFTLCSGSMQNVVFAADESDIEIIKVSTSETSTEKTTAEAPAEKTATEAPAEKTATETSTEKTTTEASTEKTATENSTEKTTTENTSTEASVKEGTAGETTSQENAAPTGTESTEGTTSSETAGTGEGTTSSEAAGSGEGTTSPEAAGSGEGTTSSEVAGPGEGTASSEVAGPGEETASSEEAASTGASSEEGTTTEGTTGSQAPAADGETSQDAADVTASGAGVEGEETQTSSNTETEEAVKTALETSEGNKANEAEGTAGTSQETSEADGENGKKVWESIADTERPDASKDVTADKGTSDDKLNIKDKNWEIFYDADKDVYKITFNIDSEADAKTQVVDLTKALELLGQYAETGKQELQAKIDALKKPVKGDAGEEPKVPGKPEGLDENLSSAYQDYVSSVPRDNEGEPAFDEEAVKTMLAEKTGLSVDDEFVKNYANYMYDQAMVDWCMDNWDTWEAEGHIYAKHFGDKDTFLYYGCGISVKWSDGQPILEKIPEYEVDKTSDAYQAYEKEMKEYEAKKSEIEAKYASDKAAYDAEIAKLKAEFDRRVGANVLEPGDVKKFELYLTSDSKHTYKYQSGSFTLATPDMEKYMKDLKELWEKDPEAYKAQFFKEPDKKHPNGWWLIDPEKLNENADGFKGFDSQILPDMYIDQAKYHVTMTAGPMQALFNTIGMTDPKHPNNVNNIRGDGKVGLDYDGNGDIIGYPGYWETEIKEFLSKYEGETMAEKLNAYLLDYYNSKDGTSYTSIDELVKANPDARAQLSKTETSGNKFFRIDGENFIVDSHLETVQFDTFYKQLFSFAFGSEKDIDKILGGAKFNSETNRWEYENKSWTDNGYQNALYYYMDHQEIWQKTDAYFQALLDGGLNAEQATWTSLMMALNIDGKLTGNDWQDTVWPWYSSIGLERMDIDFNLTKKDGETGETITNGNTEFQIYYIDKVKNNGVETDVKMYCSYDENTNSYTFVTTPSTIWTKDGRLNISYAMMKDIVYYLQEMTAPEGYERDTNIYIVMSEEDYNKLTDKDKAALEGTFDKFLNLKKDENGLGVSTDFVNVKIVTSKPTPTPPTPSRPDRPSGGGSTPPTTTIPNPIVPLTTIPNAEVPLANIPDGAVPLATIMDEDVPLANVPRTGDNSALWAVMAMLSACCLLALGILDKKQREEENS